MGRCCTEAYSERSRTGKSEILAKIINGWKPPSILSKSSILDGRQGSVVDFKLCVGIILWKFLLIKDFKKGWDKFKIIIAALETPPPSPPLFWNNIFSQRSRFCYSPWALFPGNWIFQQAHNSFFNLHFHVYIFTLYIFLFILIRISLFVFVFFNHTSK